MTFLSKSYTGLFLMLTNSCVHQNIAPIEPTYPFKIDNYYIFLDDQPGYYDVISIDTKKYCYFWKKTEDGDDLFIYDKNCDVYSDRVIVLSGNKIAVASDAKHLDDEVVGMLNYVLRNHKKNIVNNSDSITF